jgi:hypothetical protein
MAFSFGCGPSFGNINQSFEQSAADELPRFSTEAGDNRDMAGAGDEPAPFSQQAPSFFPVTTGFQTGQQQTNPSPSGQQQAQAQPAFGSPFGVAAGNKVTTPANSASISFGGPAGAGAMAFATNSFMPQATRAANPFGGIPSTAASSTSFFPGTGNPPFGTAPPASGAVSAPAPFGFGGFGNPSANNAGLNLQPGGQFNNNFMTLVAGGVPASFSQQSSPFFPVTTGFQIGQQQTNPSPSGQQQAQAQPAFGSPFGSANQSFQQLVADAKLAQSVAAAAASPHSPNFDCSNLLKPESAIVLLNAVISAGLYISSHTPSDTHITDA